MCEIEGFIENKNGACKLVIFVTRPIRNSFLGTAGKNPSIQLVIF